MFSAAGYLAMVIEAAQQIAKNRSALTGIHVSNVSFKTMLRVPDTTQRTAKPDSTFTAYGTISRDWVRDMVLRFGPYAASGVRGTWEGDINGWIASHLDRKALSCTRVSLTPFTAAAHANGAMSDESQTFYSIEWHPMFSMLTDDSFNKLVPLAVGILDAYKQEVHKFRTLQVASALSVTDALEATRNIDVGDLNSHYRRFYELLTKIATDLVDDKLPDVEEFLDTDGVILMRMGTNIGNFLQKRADPLHIMFGKDDLMTRYYDETILSKDHHYRQQRPLRVLEVGAGTGVCTEHILAGLQLETVSAQVGTFFAKAKKRLAMWEWILTLTFKKFDAAVDPDLQGIDPEECFDS
ncbi:hypothetical protein BDV12DRAFT_192748 [Aspergillus spectabilis]